MRTQRLSEMMDFGDSGKGGKSGKGFKNLHIGYSVHYSGDRWVH